MASNESENLDLWWVYVKHTGDKDEFVQVAQFLDWRPERPHEFVKGQKYVVRTNKWNREKKYDRCKVYILRMTETMDELKKSIDAKRPAIPRLNPRDSDYMSDVDGVLNSNNKRPRLSHANVGAKKLRAENKDMEKFVAQLNKPPPKASTLLVPKKSTAGSSKTSSKQSSSKSAKMSSVKVPKSPTVSLKPRTSKNTTPKHTLSKSLAPSLTSSNPVTPVRSVIKPATLTASPSTPVPRVPHLLELISLTLQVSGPSIPANKVPSSNKFSNTSTHRKTPLISTSTSVHITEPPVRSRVVKQISKEFLTASDSYTDDYIKNKDDEIKSLRRQLRAAREQLALKDDVILGEIRSLALRVGNIEEAITNMSNDSSSSGTGPGETNRLCGIVTPKVAIDGDTVLLGEDISCTLASWNTMSSTLDKIMWANSLVLGVFKEDAHKYRLLPRSEKLKFSESFKRVAKAHYLAFLKRCGHMPPYSRKTQNEILSILSARCYDSGGRRNTGTGERRPRKKKNKEGVNAESVNERNVNEGSVNEGSVSEGRVNEGSVNEERKFSIDVDTGALIDNLGRSVNMEDILNAPIEFEPINTSGGPIEEEIHDEEPVQE